MTTPRIFDADGHVFEDTAAMGKRMPKIYRDWKYAHGIFAQQPWFPPLGHLHSPTGTNPPGAFGGGNHVGVEEWMAFIDATGTMGHRERGAVPDQRPDHGPHRQHRLRDRGRAGPITRWPRPMERSDIFKGMGLIPAQEPEAAVDELRRCIVDLNSPLTKWTKLVLWCPGLKGGVR